MSSTFGAVERIAYIAGQYEVAVGQGTFQYVFYRAAGSQGVGEALKHAFSGIARTASTQSDEEAPASVPYGVCHEFAYAVGGGH